MMQASSSCNCPCPQVPCSTCSTMCGYPTCSCDCGCLIPLITGQGLVYAGGRDNLQTSNRNAAINAVYSQVYNAAQQAAYNSVYNGRSGGS